MEESQLATRASEVIKMVELEKWCDELIVNLSGGMVRRVLLATALVHQPRLLILDEPTAGVDPLLRIRFWDWFEQMVSQGTSIIVTTHNISEAARCQQVVFLRKGALLTQGTPQQLMTQYQSRDLESAFVEATKELVSKEVIL
jgi:ABC-2 type transport system ATP-binding protein